MLISRRSGEAEEAQELLLQERLQILLERLRWSYAALWTLNPHSRVLQWKRGYYSSQVDTSKAGTARATSPLQPKLSWYAQQFYTIYRSCSFTPGTGFVGRANLEGRHIWLSGDSVCQNAGSLEQSQFLSYAKIKTAMCIPWLDSVLELGTTNFVGENFQLMDQIRQVLSHDLLSVPPLHEDDVAPGTLARQDTSTNSSQAAAASLQHQQAQRTVESLQLPDPALNQPGSFQSAFDINMSDQVWRSDLVDFMQEQDSLPDLAAAWSSVGVETNQTRQKNNNAAQHASTGHGLMNLSQDAEHYGSRTYSFAGTTHAAATSSSRTSVSSHGDQYSNSPSGTRPANSTSPELLHQQIMQALSPPISVVSRFTASDRTSSTARLPQPGELHLEAYSTKHELHAAGARNQSNNLRRTTSCSGQYEIQRALSLFEAQEMQDQWRQQGLNLVSEAAGPNIMDSTHDHSNDSFNSWEHGHDPTLNINLSNQSDMNVLTKQGSKIPRAGQLQRRHTLPAMGVLKELEAYQQEAANSSMINSSEQDYLQIHAESDQPAIRPAQVQINAVPNSRRRPRAASSSRGSGAAAGHDEAALNHMMAERRRRMKQKENFATLRRLVPIISKADKASTLVDAIVYLKDLQHTIVEMKANEDDMVQRCEDLASKCIKLEEQNKELVAILSKDKPPGVVHLNTLNLHSMKSI